MNKRERELWEDYLDSNATSLRDVYGRWSDKKEEAYNDCYDAMVICGGDNFRIIRHSRYTFTCGFTYVDSGVRRFRYYTVSGEGDVPVNDDREPKY